MKVKVKWERQVFSDLELNPEESPDVFKETLYKVTGVPPERQKLLLKGVIVKDSWNNVCLSPDCALLLLGSKEALPCGPSSQTLFLEDLTESELTKASNLPPGLNNLGNTCYLNATLQCLRTIPQLRTALKRLKGTFDHNLISKENFVISIRDLFGIMDKGYTTAPIGVVYTLHGLLPQFSEKDSTGKWRQQDANEFWVQTINIMNDVLIMDLPSKNVINKYLSGTFEVKYRCTESDDEPIIMNEEGFYQLSCFISSSTKYLQLGLEANLKENLTKHSSVLNRDAIFEKVCKIKRLPAYLTVQLVRFFYKGKESINAKILRDVKFPLHLDAYQLCTPELQEKLGDMREKIKQLEDEIAANKDVKNMPVMDSEDFFSFRDDLGSNNSGLYQLQAILTHKGRSSSSGHYVAWILQEGAWVQCDDSDVSVVSEESVLKLSGGGDWHSAYILLYGPRVLSAKNLASTKDNPN